LTVTIAGGNAKFWIATVLGATGAQPQSGLGLSLKPLAAQDWW
jgi:hypothetical protein